MLKRLRKAEKRIGRLKESLPLKSKEDNLLDDIDEILKEELDEKKKFNTRKKSETRVKKTLKP